MLFREHRSTLTESLKTTKEFQTKKELIDYLKNQFEIKHFEIPLENLVCEFYCYDARINWETYILTIENYGVIGFTNCQI